RLPQLVRTEHRAVSPHPHLLSPPGGRGCLLGTIRRGARRARLRTGRGRSVAGNRRPANDRGAGIPRRRRHPGRSRDGGERTGRLLRPALAHRVPIRRGIGVMGYWLVMAIVAIAVVAVLIAVGSAEIPPEPRPRDPA